MAFNNSNNFVINGDVNAVDNSGEGTTGTLKDLLNAACPGASHQSAERADPPRCHPDTRKKIIKEIMEWIDSTNTDKPIMWFHGSAGVGKSTIAQTVAERCSREGKLLSSFFFSRTAIGTGRNEGRKLIPTIAYDLATKVSEAKEVIIGEIEHDPAVFQYSMEVQFKQLVMDPFEKIQGTDNELSVPYVVIIDGLDECNGTSVQAKIVTAFAESASLNDTSMKFFIASRPEREIQKTFDLLYVNNMSIRLSLNADLNADKDIKKYLQDEFTKLKETHIIAIDLHQSHWPTDNDMWTLVNRSSGHFIYAATVMKYISNDDRDPREALQAIIQRSMDHISEENPFAQLDALYFHILSDASSKAKGGYDAISSTICLLLLGNNNGLGYHQVLSSQENISKFLDIGVPQVILGLMHLRSLVYLPSPPKKSDDESYLSYSRSLAAMHRTTLPDWVRFYHASFQDFLLDKSRSANFYIDSMRGHKSIAQRCLDIIIHIADTETYDNVNSIVWTTPSPYWYGTDTPSSHIYALGNFFYHMIQGDVDITLLRGYRQSVDQTVKFVLTIILLKLHGLDVASSLHPPLFFRVSEEHYRITINENGTTALFGTIMSALETLFSKINQTDGVLLNYIYTHVNYCDRNYEARYPFQTLWGAAMIENPSIGYASCLDKKKIQSLLQFKLNEDGRYKNCREVEYTDMWQPVLKYYIKKFASVEEFDSFIRNRIPDVKTFSDFMDDPDHWLNRKDVVSSGSEDSDEKQNVIQSVLIEYTSTCFTNIVHEFMAIHVQEPYDMQVCGSIADSEITEESILISPSLEYNPGACCCSNCRSIELQKDVDARNNAVSDDDLQYILVTASSKINGGDETILAILRVLVLFNKHRYWKYNDPYILDSVANLAEFLEVEAAALTVQLDHLSSVIHIPQNKGQLIGFRHNSVEEFLLDKTRAGNFYIDSLNGHKLLGKRCLDIINTVYDTAYESSSYENPAPQLYALQNYFFHMRSCNFDVELLKDIGRLSDEEIYSIMSIMIKRLTIYSMMNSLENLFEFKFWSSIFSVPRNENIIDLCERVNKAIDCYVKKRAYKYANEHDVIHRSQSIVTAYIKRDDLFSGFDDFCDLWEGALMTSPERGEHLYVDEMKFRSAICVDMVFHERSSNHQKTWDMIENIVTSLIYYFCRFKKASSTFTYLMKAQYPDIELTFENSEQVNNSLRRCIRVILKDIIYDYLKHSNGEGKGVMEPNSTELNADTTSQTCLLNSEDASTMDEEEGISLWKSLFCCN